MSQHGRIISREKSVSIIKRNSNRRIPAVLTLFGIMLGIANIMEFIGLSIASPVPLTIMIMLLYTIDESIFHSEVKSVRQTVLFLLLFETIRAGFFLSNLSILAPLLDFPILFMWGTLFYQIGGLFRRNSFLIPNENCGKSVSLLNFVTGTLFLMASLGEIGAFLGLVPPIPLINTIARLSGYVAGLMIAVTCSFSNRVFLKQLKRLTQVKKRVNTNK